MSREEKIAEAARRRRDKKKNDKKKNSSKLNIKNTWNRATTHLSKLGEAVQESVADSLAGNNKKSSSNNKRSSKSGTDLASLKKKLKRHAGGRSSVTKQKLKLKIRKLEGK